MKVFIQRSLLAAAILGIAVFTVGSMAVAADDPAVSTADRSFVEAVGKSDPASLDKLLDTYFTWTDANGKTLHREDVLKSVPKAALVDEKGMNVKSYQYGDVAVVEVNGVKMHTLRIWVKRPAGWETLVYQEVKSSDASVSAAHSESVDCQNPCKEMPFKPKTDGQKEVMTAFQTLESAASSRNAALWGAATADEFVAASSNSTQLLDKQTRMTQLAQGNLAGVMPTPVNWAEMMGFPGGMVVRSMHKPDQGMPLQETSLFVRRNNKWVEALSYETTVHGASAANTDNQ